MAKTSGRCSYQIRFRGRVFVVCSPSAKDMLTRRDWKRGRFYEASLLALVRRLDFPGVYIDVGANLGNHSIFFIHFCRCTRLIAIEAVPEICEVLIQNLEANAKKGVAIDVLNRAVYCCGGFVGSWAPLNLHNLGSTALTMRPRAEHEVLGPRSIDTVCLDDVVPPQHQVAVIKLDIQGGEFQAIQGARRIITDWNPLLIAEAETHERKVQLDRLLQDEFGYARFRGTPKERTYLWWQVDCMARRGYNTAKQRLRAHRRSRKSRKRQRSGPNYVTCRRMGRNFPRRDRWKS